MSPLFVLAVIALVILVMVWCFWPMRQTAASKRK
jgi:hypothetical protein